MFRYNTFISILTILVEFSHSVPPKLADGIKEDINNFKKQITLLTAQLEKWNSLYISQLEPRMVSFASSLSSIDSNINNIQERAHVWDTFQLHVSAWNDQLSTLDRKVDIISKGQEKLLLLDSKLNMISSIDYKLNNIFKKVNTSDEMLHAINTNIQTKDDGRDMLYEEFTTRGVLSTLKSMERKMDKLQAMTLGINKSGKQLNRSPDLDEIIKDISSKVDTIFDKACSKLEKDSTESVEYREEQQNSSEELYRDLKGNSDIKLFKKIIKRINQPCRQINTNVEYLQHKLNFVENHLIKLLEDRTNNTCDVNHLSDDLLRNIKEIIKYLKNSDKARDSIISSHFIEQRAHFEKLFKQYLSNPSIETQKPNIVKNTNYSRISSTTIIPTEVNLNSKFNFIKEDISNCDDLASDDIDGVYKFKYSYENTPNDSDSDYYLRYCKKIDYSFWTVIQNREKQFFSQNFNLSWYNYKNGFGDLHGNFWFGNEFLHKLSTENILKLRIELEDFDDNQVWAEYDSFCVQSETENYRILIGKYRGNATDSLSSHNNSFFSTFDRKNDEAPECCPCAVSYGGGWWFNSCFESNLNGVYQENPLNNDYYQGIIWESWLGNMSLKKSKMLVKIKRNFDEGVISTPGDTITSTIFPFYEDP